MSLVMTYAHACYQALQETHLSLETFESQCDHFLSVFESSPALQKVLLSPLTDLEEKKSVIHALSQSLQFSPFYHHFILILIHKGRLSFLKKIREALHEIQLNSEGIVLGTCVVATPISDEQLKRLTQTLNQKLQKTIHLQVSVDPSLVAGMKVTVKGVTYDGTFRSQLQNLQDQITTALPSVYQ